MKAKAGITFTFINLADAFIQSDLQLRLRLTYNSKGYGVCFIGDDTSTLPIRSALDMVRYDFTGCAINRGRLTSYYNLYGHRQAEFHRTAQETPSTMKSIIGLFGRNALWSQFRP